MPLLRLHASKLRQMLFPRSRPGVNTLKRLHAKQHGRPIARRDLIVIEPGMRQAWATNVVSEFHDMFDKHMGDGVDLEGKVPDMSAAMETCLDSVRSKFDSTDTPEFRFPSAIMYHGSTSPSRPVLLRMVWKVLCKALAAGQPDSYNDQSGFALAAHFGVGKSTLMRMTTCAISTMMPSTRVWPCYLDLSCKDIRTLTWTRCWNLCASTTLVPAATTRMLQRNEQTRASFCSWMSWRPRTRGAARSGKVSRTSYPTPGRRALRRAAPAASR